MNSTSQNKIWSVTHDAFGNVLDSREDIHNRITYTGQQFDGITQQYYLRARFYNPVIGRFTQEDDYRGDGLNLYAYCGNNPVKYYDSSGYVRECQLPPVNSEGRYTEAYYEGKTKVDKIERDISRKVFQRNDIDWNRIDPNTGLTNKQLAEGGFAPYANDGTKIELHHLIQKEPGSMVEIPASLHDKYSKQLHGLIEDGESFRNDPILEKEYNNFRSKYWRWRAKNLN